LRSGGRFRLGAHAQTNTNLVTLPEVNITARRIEAARLRLS
jgi:ribosomal protein L16/L10AE